MIQVELHEGDCLEVMKGMPDASVDSIVTDPPYGLSFMGKKWDYDVPSVDIWKECLRVLKPGGHLLAFAGARTQHRMACRIEDAGFELRDMLAMLYDTEDAFRTFVNTLQPQQLKLFAGVLSVDSLHAWIYGSGFPKSRNLEGEWQGWGTALKPAIEPITVARKPFKGSVAKNVLTHGTGALNIDACRVPFAGGADKEESKAKNSHAKFGTDTPVTQNAYGAYARQQKDYDAPGRWPANVLHDGSPEVLAHFPHSSVTGKRKTVTRTQAEPVTTPFTRGGAAPEYTDSGSAARFFYCPKTSPKDRHEGLERSTSKIKHGSTLREIENQANERTGNDHPTVKPTQLMAYLCRLITPPGGVVLDPFTGSGSTGKGALSGGFSFIGIEKEAHSISIARARLIFMLDKLGLPHNLYN